MMKYKDWDWHNMEISACSLYLKFLSFRKRALKRWSSSDNNKKIQTNGCICVHSWKHRKQNCRIPWLQTHKQTETDKSHTCVYINARRHEYLNRVTFLSTAAIINQIMLAFFLCAAARPFRALPKKFIVWG